jgi:hypothetical protein
MQNENKGRNYELHQWVVPRTTVAPGKRKKTLNEIFRGKVAGYKK